MITPGESVRPLLKLALVLSLLHFAISAFLTYTAIAYEAQLSRDGRPPHLLFLFDAFDVFCFPLVTLFGIFALPLNSVLVGTLLAVLIQVARSFHRRAAAPAMVALVLMVGARNATAIPGVDTERESTAGIPARITDLALFGAFPFDSRALIGLGAHRGTR
jgi:hypothetical protein